MSPKEQFEKSAKSQIQAVWKRRPNPMFPYDEPGYPASLTNLVQVEIDGQMRWFRVVTKEFIPPKSPF
jgi:hypothetical protein